MKTRSGFVSNSSSSSFIIVGCSFDDKVKEELKRLYPLNEKEKADKYDGEYDWQTRIQSLTGLSILYVEPGHVIGKVLSEFDGVENYLERQAYSLEDLERMAKEVARVLNHPNYSDMKLTMGTRPT